MNNEDIKFWRYYIPAINGEGWGIFLLDSTGMFSAVTDYANAAYKWDYHAKKDFRQFFAKGMSSTRLLNNLFYHLREYDPDETLKSVKEYILHLRGDQSLTREAARKEWDLLEQYDWLDNDADFTRWHDETNLNDVGELYKLGYPSDAQAFVEKLMPRFCEAVAADLAEESE
ncbi:hypothetical protein [Paenibacillus polymyxa]|uniref:Uncharacterized protein n=1 Tax=Paenibacillus polymyxa (strain SC2) TaxID=886882 RepID=E3EK74_PAEPS|nr:hypothetical protein [Paenibacillus polymyxa]ADO59783.1 hypothetical protein PPSC2_26250 [Paenibacillus polymyxa SC2]WPQ59981.1 hypothetical protein SKN87_27445 [Paenibacillus polymyxa]